MKKMVYMSVCLLLVVPLGAMEISSPKNECDFKEITADNFLKMLSDIYTDGGMKAVKAAIGVVQEQEKRKIVNRKEDDLQTFLEFAVSKRDIDLFKMLLLKGADPEVEISMNRSIKELVTLEDSEYSSAIEKAGPRNEVKMLIPYVINEIWDKETIIKKLLNLDGISNNSELLSEFLKEYYDEMIDSAQTVGGLCNKIGKITLKGYPVQSAESISKTENELKQLKEQLETASSEKNELSEKQKELLETIENKVKLLQTVKSGLITQLGNAKGKLKTLQDVAKCDDLEQVKKLSEETIDEDTITCDGLLVKLGEANKLIDKIEEGHVASNSFMTNNIEIFEFLPYAAAGLAFGGFVALLFHGSCSIVDELTQ